MWICFIFQKLFHFVVPKFKFLQWFMFPLGFNNQTMFQWFMFRVGFFGQTRFQWFMIWAGFMVKIGFNGWTRFSWYIFCVSFGGVCCSGLYHAFKVETWVDLRSCVHIDLCKLNAIYLRPLHVFWRLLYHVSNALFDCRKYDQTQRYFCAFGM